MHCTHIPDILDTSTSTKEAGVFSFFCLLSYALIGPYCLHPKINQLQKEIASNIKSTGHWRTTM